MLTINELAAIVTISATVYFLVCVIRNNNRRDLENIAIACVFAAILTLASSLSRANQDELLHNPAQVPNDQHVSDNEAAALSSAPSQASPPPLFGNAQSGHSAEPKVSPAPNPLPLEASSASTNHDGAECCVIVQGIPLRLGLLTKYDITEMLRRELSILADKPSYSCQVMPADISTKSHDTYIKKASSHGCPLLIMISFNAINEASEHITVYGLDVTTTTLRASGVVRLFDVESSTLIARVFLFEETVIDAEELQLQGHDVARGDLMSMLAETLIDATLGRHEVRNAITLSVGERDGFE